MYTPTLDEVSAFKVDNNVYEHLLKHPSTLRKPCYILLKLGADSSSKDNNHWTPLMWASKLGREKACQELLNVHVSVDDVNMDGDTALHVACRQGHVGIVNLLLTNGASLNARNMQSLTCLETAAQAGNGDVALAMVKHPR